MARATGKVNGVAVDGLSVVAVVASDINLSTHEMAAPAAADPDPIRSISRATAAQRDALVAMARSLSPDVRDIVDVKAVPITFRRDAEGLAVTAGEASLEVATKMEHSPNCGAMQWFDPLAKTTTSAMGHTSREAWSGSSLGTQWSLGDKRASFYGAFESVDEENGFGTSNEPTKFEAKKSKVFVELG